MLSIKKLLTKILWSLNKQPLIIETLSLTKTISTKSGLLYKFSLPIYDRYEAVGIIGYENNHGNSVYITSLNVSDSSEFSVYIYNSASSAQSTTIAITVLYEPLKIGI